MTAEEIKERYSMHDILSMYGMQTNRNGYICCPFHKGDHTPSLKVYQRDFYCFACGASGDIFTFVQKMDNLSFKEAFRLLGGDYQKPGMEAQMKAYHARKERDMKTKRRAAFRKMVRDNLDAITELRNRISTLEPFSEEYSSCQMEMTRQIALFEHLQEHWGEEGGIWSR